MTRTSGDAREVGKFEAKGYFPFINVVYLPKRLSLPFTQTYDDFKRNSKGKVRDDKSEGRRQKTRFPIIVYTVQ